MYNLFLCRKLLKATIILIPLFGVPYMISFLLSFSTNGSPILDIIWIFFDQMFIAFQVKLQTTFSEILILFESNMFQGLFAALLYCLLNHEVQIEVKRKYMFLKDRNGKEFKRSRTISHTQQISLQTNEDENDNDNQHLKSGGVHHGDNIC